MSATPPLIIAHRGASAHAPENTLAAFRRAVADVADGVELDVQLSADGAAVVYHDRTLRRTTGVRGRLASVELARLRELDCGSWYDAGFCDERVPTLDEALDVLRGLDLINLELKSAFDVRNESTPLVATVVEALRRAEVAPKVLLSSFDHRHIAAALRLAPDIARGVLIHPVDFGQPSRAASRVGATTVVLARRQLSLERVADAREHGLRVMVYTIDAPRDIIRCIRLGVDGIITNDPVETRRRVMTLLAADG